MLVNTRREAQEEISPIDISCLTASRRKSVRQKIVVQKRQAEVQICFRIKKATSQQKRLIRQVRNQESSQPTAVGSLRGFFFVELL